jgi:hypothetical protein
MSDCAAAFTRKSIDVLSIECLPNIAQSVQAMAEPDLWWRPNDASNSAGNLLLHLKGNVTQWIIGGVGGRPFERHRQGEFDARNGPSRDVLLAQLTAVVTEACGIIGEQTGSTLLERRQIQGHDVTVLEAIYHVVEHFSMHTGQVILLAKARTGMDLGLWRPSSEETARTRTAAEETP